MAILAALYRLHNTLLRAYGGVYSILPFEHFQEARRAPNRARLIEAAVIYGPTVNLFWADGTHFEVSREWFETDSTDLEVLDYGHTLRIGDLEFASDAIIENAPRERECDPDTN